jgi:hypothetical protein
MKISMAAFVLEEHQLCHYSVAQNPVRILDVSREYGLKHLSQVVNVLLLPFKMVPFEMPLLLTMPLYFVIAS